MVLATQQKTGVLVRLRVLTAVWGGKRLAAEEALDSHGPMDKRHIIFPNIKFVKPGGKNCGADKWDHVFSETCRHSVYQGSLHCLSVHCVFSQEVLPNFPLFNTAEIYSPLNGGLIKRHTQFCCITGIWRRKKAAWLVSNLFFFLLFTFYLEETKQFILFLKYACLLFVLCWQKFTAHKMLECHTWFRSYFNGKGIRCFLKWVIRGNDHRIFASLFKRGTKVQINDWSLPKISRINCQRSFFLLLAARNKKKITAVFVLAQCLE